MASSAGLLLAKPRSGALAASNMAPVEMRSLPLAAAKTHATNAGKSARAAMYVELTVTQPRT